MKIGQKYFCVMNKQFLTHFTILLLSITLICACIDEELQDREFPRLISISVENIEDSSVTFSGEIFRMGTETIIDHGFLWNTYAMSTLEHSPEVSLGDRQKIGEFSATITGGMKKGVSYYVKAYALTESYLVFSPPVLFESKGSSAPVIDSFSPSEGVTGAEITIKGINFSHSGSFPDIEVLFNDEKANILNSDLTEITCKVPLTLVEKVSQIYVKVDDKIAKASDTFLLID